MFHKSGILFLNREEAEVLRAFAREPWQELSAPQVKKMSGKRSQHYVYAALGKMSKMGILKSKKAGKTVLYSLDLASRPAITNLASLEEMSALQMALPQRNIGELIDSIKTPFFSFLITGSYAAGKQTPKSDLDVVVIIDSSRNKREVEAWLRKGDIMIPEVHTYVFTADEFLAMLLADEANYGKLMVKKRAIAYGAAFYYRILEKAVKNGFRG